MTTAQDNGWHGFDTAGSVQRVPGGWEYRCDGMPSMFGCPSSIIVTRKWSCVGRKKSGWVVTHGLEPKTPDTPFDDPDGWEPHPDVVLTFCPACAEVVRQQEARRTGATS